MHINKSGSFFIKFSLYLTFFNNVPLATNIATAEVLVTALEAGSLNWREFVNPRSEYNLRKRAK